ncbi:MAG: phosphoribosyltransferase [Promethearchaeota archaeon]
MAKVIDEPTFRNKLHVFNDRFHAGVLLAEKLVDYKSEKDVCILAIPAGGIQVAYAIVQKLKIPLDLAITRKIHIPWNKEPGFGAISWNGKILLNETLVSSLGLTREIIGKCVEKEKEALDRRLKLFRGNKTFPDLRNKIVIIVDDGLASGFSMLTTVKAIEENCAKEIVVAVPTSSNKAIKLVSPHVEKIICLNIRSGIFFAVADAYKNWYDLNDRDVIKIVKLVES